MSVLLMPSWNDTFTAATNWQEPAFLQMFVDAINERLALTGKSANALADVVEGDVIQGGLAGASVGAGALIVRMQKLVNIPADSIGSGWEILKPDVDPATAGAGDWDDDLVLSASDGSLYSYAGLSSSGFTRKYPREVLSDSSTSYINGGSIANGHIARRRSDMKIVERVSGAWVEAVAGTLPDVLTAHGYLTVGDYIGPWLFNELRDVLNLWGPRFGMFGTNDTPDSGDVMYGQATGEPSWAAAKAAAEAALADYFFAGSWHTAGNTGYFAAMNKGTVTFTWTGLHTASASTRAMYVLPQSPPTTFGETPTFYAQGLAMTEGQWFRVAGDLAGTPSTASSETTGKILDSLPAWCDEPTSGPVSKGLYLGTGAWLVMDFSGALTYGPP